MPAVNHNDKTLQWPVVVGNGKDLSFIDKDLSCTIKNTFLEFSCGDEPNGITPPTLKRERSKSDTGCGPVALFSPLLNASQSPKASPKLTLSSVKEMPPKFDGLLLPPSEPLQNIDYSFCAQECGPNGEMMADQHVQNMMACSFMEPYEYYEGVTVDGMGLAPAYDGVDGSFVCQMGQQECFGGQEMCMIPYEDGAWVSMDGTLPMSSQHAMCDGNNKTLTNLNADGCMDGANCCDQVMMDPSQVLHDMGNDQSQYSHEAWEGHEAHSWKAPVIENTGSTQSWADSWSGSDSPLVHGQEAPLVRRTESPQGSNRSPSGYRRDNVSFNYRDQDVERSMWRDQDVERPMDRGRRIGGVGASGGKGRGRGEKEPVKTPSPENYTTVMLRNIPNKYTQQMLLNRLNKDFQGEFDFMYLPIDFKNKCNVGYGFINFRTPEACQNFIQEFDGVDVRKCLPGLNSRKVAEVTPARMQGKAENVRRLTNSPVMHQLEDHPDWMPLVFNENGEQVPFPTGNYGSQ